MIQRRILTPLLLTALAATGAAAPIQFTSPYGANSQASKTTQNATSAAPEGLVNAPDDLLHRDTLLGDLGGLRDQAGDAGFSITPVYEAEVFGSMGTGHDGAISDGLLDVALDVDLERVTHFWEDAVFHLNILDIYGDSLSQKYVGDFSNTSNIAGYNTFRLQEIWLQQSLWEKRISIRAGMLAADTEYFGSQAASLFLNGTFGAFTLVGLNFNDAPVYPVSAPAVRVDVAPTSFLDFKVGVFAPNENSENYNHGTDFAIDRKDGALFALEAAYLLNQSPNDRGLVGTYKVGAFIQRGDYATWTSQAANALDPDATLHHGTNWAVYAVADQELFKNGDYTIEAFARGGFASAQYSFVNNYFDAGFNFIGIVPGRQLDIVGLGVARSGISTHYSDAQIEQGGLPFNAETVLELTYKAQITPWWVLQPDFQVVLDPGAESGAHDAYVLGLRTTITF